MKKYIIFAFAALLAAAACTKVTTISTQADQAITFQVVNYSVQTKVDAYSTSDTFGAFAFATPTSWAEEGDANVFFSNEQIVYGPQYASGEWGPATQYYWPKSAKLTFACYSPYMATPPTFSKADGFVFANYSIAPDEDPVDLMVADIAIDKSANESQYRVSQNSKSVPTLFHHILSKVAFAFKTIDNPNPNVAKSEVQITDVKITGIYSKATYTQNNTPVWAGQSGDDTYVYNASTLTMTESSPIASSDLDTESYILMPQVLGTVDATSTTTPAPVTYGPQNVVISYVVRTMYKNTITTANPDGTWSEESFENVTIPLYDAGVAEWTPNMSILYTITIKPFADEPILFDPAIAEWTSATGAITVQ